MNGDIMKKCIAIIPIIILLAFILISCSALGKTTSESSSAVTTNSATESLAADTANSTEISTAEDTAENTAAIAPPADPNVITDVPFPGNIAEPEFNTPFDLTAYYTEPEPVADAYNFTIITNYSYWDEYYDGNDFKLPRLISDKPGAVLFNKKIIDDFLSKTNNLLVKLSDKNVIQYQGASSDYCYTINGDIIIISLITYGYNKESEGWSNRSVYYYDSVTDCELTLDEYLAEIGESRQSIIDIINEDSIRLTYSGYYYGDDFYFTVENLVSAYKRDDGAFCVIVKTIYDEIVITTPYIKENNYFVYTLSGNSDLKYNSIKFKQADDNSNGWSSFLRIPSYRNYGLIWIDNETVAVTYYIKPNLRSFAVININNKYDDDYNCHISVEDILTANRIDPDTFKTKPELDIYSVKLNNNKILTIQYRLVGYNLNGELYYNTKTDEVYFPDNEEKPVYIADASKLINKSENHMKFTFPHKGITLTMTIPDYLTKSSFKASFNDETIFLQNGNNWDISINCYRNYTSAEMTPEEGCKDFLTNGDSFPGKIQEMVTDNVFVSNIMRFATNGKKYTDETEFIIAYYLSGEDDIFITLNSRGVATYNLIKEIAKSISWSKTIE